MQKYAIIVAGGSGNRFGSSIPKQFLLLKGRPVLMHTIEAFYNCNQEIKIILALPASQIDYWKEICNEYHFPIKHRIVEGGTTRFYSVKNCIDRIDCTDSLIAIHDGVRPLISKSIIENAYSVAQSQQGSAIPAIAVTDSIRFKNIDTNTSNALNRQLLAAVQTPQTFMGDKLKQAYDLPFSDEFTDDASVFEKKGFSITLIDGDSKNIKITNPLDLAIAELILNTNG